MIHKSTCYIGLGSNLENPQQQILSAIEQLRAIKNTIIKKCSSLYHTKAIGNESQPDFVNAVIEIETTLSPHELLQQLLIIEQQHGRKRIEKWGPRTLDLDILLFDSIVLTTDELTIPHPRMLERAFVLVPLFEIAPELQKKLNPTITLPKLQKLQQP